MMSLLKSFCFVFVVFALSLPFSLSWGNSLANQQVVPLAGPSAGSFPSKKLAIGIFSNPPFSFQGKDGLWRGIAVDLFKKIADRNSLQYEFKPLQNITYPLLPRDTLERIDFSQYDVILWSLPNLVIRHNLAYTYTLPYYTSNIVAVQKQKSFNFLKSLFDTLLSKEIGWSLLAMLGLTLIGTVIMWISEREIKGSHFRSDFKGGLWDAFWWCASIISTVFACDLFPKSTLGRCFSIIWTIVGITFFWTTISTISSSLTINRLNSAHHLDTLNLADLKVSVVKDSTVQVFLRHRVIPYQEVPDILAGFQEIQEGKSDVFVGPEPLVRYYLYAYPEYDNLVVSPLSFATVYFSFIVPMNSSLLHMLNYEILYYTDSEFWRHTLDRYMGPFAALQ